MIQWAETKDYIERAILIFEKRVLGDIECVRVDDGLELDSLLPRICPRDFQALCRQIVQGHLVTLIR